MCPQNDSLQGVGFHFASFGSFLKFELVTKGCARYVGSSTVVVTTNQLSRPAADQPIDTMHGLGRSLFTDYLFAVELAGTLLLIAVIGAIAVAPRRPEGTL